MYQILVANDDVDNIEMVLVYLMRRKHWKIFANYPREFRVSHCIDYSDEKCQLYTSLFRSIIYLYLAS